TDVLQDVKKRRALEPIGQEQRSDVGLLEDVCEFMGAVGRVDVDQNGADVCGGELGQDPLRPVGGPNAEVVAALDAEGHQGTGQFANVRLKFRVAAAVAQLGKDQGIAVGVAFDGLLERLGNGQAVNPGVFGGGHTLLLIGKPTVF